MAPRASLLGALLLASLDVSFGLPAFALDTDIGTDFDDMWAMTYLLSRSIPDDPSRTVNFKLVQCSTYNTTNRARIVAKAMFDLRRFDVPIAVGLYTGEDHMAQLPAVGDFELSDFVAAGGTVYYGTDYLAGLMAEATPDEPLFVVEIAPVTSLGGILRDSPGLAANVIATAMSGSVYKGYGGGPVSAEYNVVQNVSASQAMYSASWLSPLMTAPLDTSGLLHCKAPEWGDLIAANTSAHPYVQTLLYNYQVWCDCMPTPSGSSDTLYDAQAAWQAAVYYAANWTAHGVVPPAIPALTLQVLRMSVNATGYTVVDPAGQPVWPAVAFPGGLDNATHTVCGALIDSIVAAQVA